MKIAVLGYGYWGPNVVRSLCQLVGAEGVVVCDPRRDALARAAAEHPGVALCDNPIRLLRDDAIDAVYVCTPAGTHFELAGEALDAGKHVLIEKPFTTSSEEARSLFRRARQAGLVLMAGHLYLHAPAVRALKDVIESGELGELRYVYSQWTSLGPRAREDVSVVWDYFAHDAYLIPYLAGSAPVSVTACGGSYLRPGIADVVFATVRFPGSVVASCHAGWYDPLKVRRLCVVGSRKMALYDDCNADSPLVVYDRGYAPFDGIDAFGNRGLERYDRGAEAVPVAGEPPLLAQCRAFLEAVRTGFEIEEHEASVLATTSLLEATELSLKDGGRCMTLQQPALSR